LSISDNGSGIPDDIKSSIFEPFFSTKGRNKGTGLGLTIVNNIVKQHKGLISFDSELDKGTTFKIYLPVKNEKENENDEIADKALVTKPSGRHLVMVVDDEKNIRIMTKKILMEMGYDVITVDNWIDAIETYTLRNSEIDAVILDLIMPEKSGKEIFIEMQKINKNLKVILISGAKKDDRIREMLEMGAKVFLPKPFSFNELSMTVRKIIDEN
jgi:CheY-like chemotaxis protein